MTTDIMTNSICEGLQTACNPVGPMQPAAGRSLRVRLTSGTAWSALGAVVAQGSALLTAILLARMLAAENFGWLVLIQSTVLLLQNLGGLGLGLATTAQVATLRDRAACEAGRVICLAMTMAASIGTVVCGVTLLAPQVTVNAVLGPLLPMQPFRLIGPMALLGMLGRVQTDALMGLEAFATAAAVSILRGLATILLAGLGAYVAGLGGAVWGMTGAYLVTAVLSYVAVAGACNRRGIGIRLRGPAGGYRLLAASIYMTASSMTLTAVTWILNLGLCRQDNGLVELAVFNAADRWRTAILFLPGLLAQVTLPLFAHASAQAHGRDCQRLLIWACGAALAAAAGPALIVILLSKTLMASFGQDFASGGGILGILATSCLPASLSMVGAYCLWATSKKRTMLAIDIVRSCITLGYCLAQAGFDATDVAFANLLGYSTSAVLIGLILGVRVYRVTGHPYEPAGQI